jgi:hypothetical protein
MSTTEDITPTVNRILNADVRGTYDLAWYTAEDLYWQVARLNDDGTFPPGTAQADVIAAVAAWMETESRNPATGTPA